MLIFITRIMRAAGYPGIVALMFLENVFPPIPSEVIMPLAGFMARRGDFGFIGIVAAGTVGSLLGALPLYYIGRRVGEERLTRWADRHGTWLALSGEDIRDARRWFDRHGRKAVLVGRLVPGVRSLISVPAGMHQMGIVAFLLWTTLGSAAWTATLAGAGYLLGSQYTKVEKVVGPASYVVLGAAVAAYAVRVIRIRQRRG